MGGTLVGGKGKRAKQKVVVTVVACGDGERCCDGRCPYRDGDECFLAGKSVGLRYNERDDEAVRCKFCRNATSTNTPETLVAHKEDDPSSDVDLTRFATLELTRTGVLDDSTLGKKLRPLLPMLQSLHSQLQEAVTKFGENLDSILRNVNSTPEQPASPLVDTPMPEADAQGEQGNVQ